MKLVLVKSAYGGKVYEIKSSGNRAKYRDAGGKYKRK